MRRWVIIAASLALVAGGADVRGFAAVPTAQAAAGEASWSEDYFGDPCRTLYFNLNVYVAVRVGGRPWVAGFSQTPSDSQLTVLCGTAPGGSFPGVWVTGSASNAVTQESVPIWGTCGGYSRWSVNLYCDLSFDGTPTLLYLTLVSGRTQAS